VKRDVPDHDATDVPAADLAEDGQAERVPFQRLREGEREVAAGADDECVYPTPDAGLSDDERAGQQEQQVPELEDAEHERGGAGLTVRHDRGGERPGDEPAETGDRQRARVERKRWRRGVRPVGQQTDQRDERGVDEQQIRPRGTGAGNQRDVGVENHEDEQRAPEALEDAVATESDAGVDHAGETNQRQHRQAGVESDHRHHDGQQRRQHERRHEGLAFGVLVGRRENARTLAVEREPVAQPHLVVARSTIRHNSRSVCPPGPASRRTPTASPRPHRRPPAAIGLPPPHRRPPAATPTPPDRTAATAHGRRQPVHGVVVTP
jgi:hypothetical protein